MASSRPRRELKAPKKFINMIDMGLYYMPDEENSASSKKYSESEEETEPAPPFFYERPKKRQSSSSSSSNTIYNESEEEEGEPAPPSFYEKPAKRRMLPKATSIVKFSGEANGQPFQYTPGEKNVHLDTQAGDMSTFGRQEVDIFIYDVNYFGHMIFRIRPIQKSVSYIANWIDYEMTLTETPQSLHVKGRSELGFKAKTLVENSLYGTFQMRGDVMHLEFFRDAAKTTPFFTFSVKNLIE